MNIGYACINITLSSHKPKVTTNRSMVKRTFMKRGISYASELALQNVTDLLTILKWNDAHNIKLFRISSDVFPWASEYQLTDLPDYDLIARRMAEAGRFAVDRGIRITTHPGPFVVLTSPHKRVIQNSISDLTIHGDMFDLLGLSRTPYNKINIHCNGVYGDKQSAMDRFCRTFAELPYNVQSRLTVENDDSKNMYSVKDLMYIHNEINIPIVFDGFHHTFNTGGLSENEALSLACSTWINDIRPIIHYSESKSIHENNNKLRPQAHSDYIKQIPDVYGFDVDIMVEAKQKELAILPFVTN